MERIKQNTDRQIREDWIQRKYVNLEFMLPEFREKIFKKREQDQLLIEQNQNYNPQQFFRNENFLPKPLEDDSPKGTTLSQNITTLTGGVLQRMKKTMIEKINKLEENNKTN